VLLQLGEIKREQTFGGETLEQTVDFFLGDDAVVSAYGENHVQPSSSKNGGQCDLVLDVLSQLIFFRK
jgi:hypothetical protein